jgi:tetratricopeptide (TPR) repeat protein
VADAWRQVDLAFALAMAGQPEDAVRVAETALPGASPEIAAALHFDLALAYRQRGDPGRAAAELTRADALRPDPRLREARQLLAHGMATERAPLQPAAELARRSLPSAPLRGDEDLDWWLVQHQADAASPAGRRVDLYVFTACEDLASWCQTAVVAVRQPARDVADVVGRAVVEHEGHPGSLTAAGQPATWRLRTALRRGVRPRWRERHVDLSSGTPAVVQSGATAGGTGGGTRAARAP